MVDVMFRGELMEFINRLLMNKFNIKVKCLFLCSLVIIIVVMVMIIIKVLMIV